MVVISDIIVQGVQMLLVLLLAPLLTGFVRKIKARLVRRQGASVFHSLIAICCGCCARRSCWRTMRHGCFG